MNDNIQGTYRGRFLALRKGTLIKRWEKYAYWTLPSLIVPEGHKSTEDNLVRDFQEFGALLVNNLSSKLAGLLFPPGRAFFKAEPSKEMLDYAAKSGVSTPELQSVLATAEVAASNALYVNAAYAQINNALKLLLITGNALVFRDTQNMTLRVYPPTNYVTLRGPDGTLIEMILKEAMSYGSIPQEYKSKLIAKNAKYTKYRPDDVVWRYTRVVLMQPVVEEGIPKNPVHVETQQLDDVQVDYEVRYPVDTSPWMAPTWNLICGEHYGRGLVEDYAAGFAKLSSLAESSTLYAIELMKVLNLVAPGAMADLEELNSAKSGAYVQGVPGQIAPYMQGASVKLQEVEGQITTTAQNLAKAFMYKGNTRNAERVTEYELRLDAQEAEQSLGGAYSTLSAALQLPLARVLFSEIDTMIRDGMIAGHLKPKIISGLQSLGRSADIQNLVAASQEIAAIVPVLQQMDKRVDVAKVIDLIMMARSVDFKSLQKSDAQLQQEAQAQQQQLQGQQSIAQAQAMAAQQDQLQTLGQ